jgi:hypothetical protein
MAIAFVDGFTTSAGSDTTSPKTHAVTVSPGDIVIVCGCTGGNATDFGSPTATGLTFTKVKGLSNDSSFNNNTSMWKALVSSASTTTVSLSYAVSTGWSLGVFHYSGVASVGASQITATGVSSKTISITTTVSHSVIALLLNDFNGNTGPPTANTSSAGSFSASRGNVNWAGVYALSFGEYPDDGTSGAKTVGATDSTTFTLIAVELIPTAISPPRPPRSISQAVKRASFY